MDKADTFVNYFTVADEKKIFKVLRETSGILARRDLAWMQLLRHTAVRLAVLQNFTVAQAKRCVTEKRFYINGDVNKRGKHGDFYANEHVVKAVAELLAVNKKMLRTPTPDDDRPLVINGRDQALTARNYQYRMGYWAKKAELDIRPTPHWWRHTWAKRQVAASDSFETVQLVMRRLQHTNLQTTLIYLKPDKEALDQFNKTAI